MGRAPDYDILAALSRLDEVWGELRRLVDTCGQAGVVTQADEENHTALLREARTLHGRNHTRIGKADIQWGGRYFDAFQFVLGQPTLKGVYLPFQGSSMWLEHRLQVPKACLEGEIRVVAVRRSRASGVVPDDTPAQREKRTHSRGVAWEQSG